MAEVNVKKNQEQQGNKQQENTPSREEQRMVTEGEQTGLSQRERMPSFFSLTPRDFLTASPLELMRRFSEEIDRFLKGLARHGAERRARPVPGHCRLRSLSRTAISRCARSSLAYARRT